VFQRLALLLSYFVALTPFGLHCLSFSENIGYILSWTDLCREQQLLRSYIDLPFKSVFIGISAL
jgi:hypothetical protein